MAKKVTKAVYKDGIVIYSNSGSSTSLDSNHKLDKRRSFEELFGPCQESFKRSFFAYKSLVSQSSRIMYKGIPVKSKERGGTRYKQTRMPVDYGRIRHEFGLPTFDKEEEAAEEVEEEAAEEEAEKEEYKLARMPVDYGRIRHEFGLPTFDKEEAEEKEFRTAMSNIIKGLSTDITTTSTPEDKKVLEDLIKLIDKVSTTNADTKVFNKVMAEEYNGMIDRALQSKNIIVRKSLFVFLKQLEKKYARELNISSENISYEDKIDDLTRVISDLSLDEIAYLFTIFNDKNKEHNQVLEKIISYQNKTFKTKDSKYIEAAKKRFIKLYARRNVELQMEKGPESKITSGGIAALTKENSVSIDLLISELASVNEEIIFGTKDYSLEDFIKKLYAEEESLKIDEDTKFDSLESAIAFISRCQVLISTIKKSELTKDIATENEDLILLSTTFREYYDMAFEVIRNTIKDDIERGELSELSKAIYLELWSKAEEKNLKQLLETSLGHNPTEKGAKSYKERRKELKAYIDRCSIDPKTGEKSLPTDRLKRINTRNKENSYIGYALKSVEELIGKGETTDTLFDELARLEQLVLRDIIIADANQTTPEDLFKKKTEVTAGTDSKGKKDYYDEMDICYLLFTEPDAIDRLRERYNGEELSFNFEKIGFKSSMLTTISRLKDHAFGIVVTNADIEIIRRNDALAQKIVDKLDEKAPLAENPALSEQQKEQILLERMEQARQVVRDLEQKRLEIAEQGRIEKTEQEKIVFHDHEKELRDILSSSGIDDIRVSEPDDYIITFGGVSGERVGLYLKSQIDRDGQVYLSPTHVMLGIKLIDGKVVIFESYEDFILKGTGITEARDKLDHEVKVSTSDVHTVEVEGPVEAKKGK